MDMFAKKVLSFVWDNKQCYVSPESEHVFFEGKEYHIETLWKRGWDSLYVAAVDALVQYDEVQYYG